MSISKPGFRGTSLTIATLLAALTAAPQALAAAPQITALSAPSAPRNGRIVITGSGFGPAPALSPDARVEIGGVRAATASWTDGRIAAYPGEGTPEGDTTLRVVTSEGSSLEHPITVEPLPPAWDHLAWKLQGDGYFGTRRPAVGPDGTVYAGDSHGFVYALSPDGQVRWIYDGVRQGGHDQGLADRGPIAVGADGTVYVAVDPLGPALQLHAIAPDGAKKWVLTEEWASVVSGPSIGPDGDVYHATTLPGHGLQRISPDGTRVWTAPGDPLLDDAHYERSMDVVFGPRKAGGVVDQLYFAVSLADIYVGDPSPPMLFGFGVEGGQRFSVNVGSLAGSFGALRGQPSVGPDGTVYLASSYLPSGWGMHAYDPKSGAKLWSWKPWPGNHVTSAEPGPDGTLYLTHDGAYLTALGHDGSVRWEVTMDDYQANESPVVSPDGAVLLVDNSKTNNGLTGAIAAYSTDGGELLWRVPLSAENGTWQGMLRRARFSPGGERAYVVTGFGGQPDDDRYGYLWAFDIATEGPGPGTGGGGSGGAPPGTGGGGGSGGSPPGTGGAGGAGGGDPAGGSGGDAGEDSASSGEGCSMSTTRGGAPDTGVLAALAAAAGVVLARRRRREAGHCAPDGGEPMPPGA